MVELSGSGNSLASLGFVQKGEVVEARGYVGVLRPERLLHDRQCALVERLGLGVSHGSKERHVVAVDLILCGEHCLPRVTQLVALPPFPDFK